MKKISLLLVGVLLALGVVGCAKKSENLVVGASPA